MGWLFLGMTLLGAVFTVNAWRPVRSPAPFAIVSFFAGWLTAELAAVRLQLESLAGDDEQSTEQSIPGLA